ncbi:MAG: hypothetical protein O7B79_07790 [SAR324 cluster bacterium]|nr:hypothetical protein [SAR324 cluster bacterium]
MMIFEKAIEDASTMFLFDRRSQQQLHEMAEEAAPGSKDRYLILLTQAAFTYYNDYESQGWDIRNSIRQAQVILREVKRFRQDRIFFTLALRMEVDILLHNSRLNYGDAPAKDKLKNLFNEEDARALSICDTLLKNLPPQIEPLPNAWYTSLIPLMPSFQDEVLKFYGDRVKENRLEVLERMLKQIKAELIMASAIIAAKKFLASTKVDIGKSEWVYKLLLESVRGIMARLGDEMPVAPQVISDITLPKGISQGQLEIALESVQKELDQANADKDMPKYTSSLLQMGILHFLRNNEVSAVKCLISALRASANLDEEIRKSRQYRHDLFPDIPFMVGTSFLKLGLADRQDQIDDGGNLNKGMSGLLRALLLNSNYHQAYVNLALAMHLASEPGLEEVLQMYLGSFDGDLAQLDRHLFRNLAVLEAQAHDTAYHPEALKWLIVSHFSLGGELTKGKKMLQELKNLYLLNAHELASRYLESYRSAFRLNDQEFIADLEENTLHSAILYHIAHSFASRALSQGKDSNEVVLDHEHLDQSIELNTDALYFNARSMSALRLIDTQKSIIQFALGRTEKRWEQINTNLSNRFTLYENYLREMKSYNLLKERLVSVKMDKLVPTMKFSETAVLRMDVTLTSDQKERLRTRVGLN